MTLGYSALINGVLRPHSMGSSLNGVVVPHSIGFAGVLPEVTKAQRQRLLTKVSQAERTFSGLSGVFASAHMVSAWHTKMIPQMPNAQSAGVRGVGCACDICIRVSSVKH